MRAMPKAALLDVDGTLVDSNDLHAEAWRVALKDAGWDVPFARIRGLIGMGGDKLVPAVTGLDADDPKVKELGDRRLALFTRDYLPRVRPFPRVRELLEHMQGEGLRLVVATSARPEEYRPLLQRAGVEDLLFAETSKADVDASKPDPDIVCAALAKAGAQPEEAIMLGDSPYDVEAARKAGVAVVALRCGGFPDAALTGAAAIYDSPADLLERFPSSPFAGAASALARSSKRPSAAISTSSSR